jgi:hypothetical protein
MMTDPAHELDWQVATIAAFVVKQKRDRYIEKISSAKKRAEFLKSLAHSADFDPRYIVQIAPSSQHAFNIMSVLRSKGAPPTCQLISEDSSLDTMRLPLEEALSRIVGYQMGTILCCIPGHLAFFENEDVRYILEKKA